MIDTFSTLDALWPVAAAALAAITLLYLLEPRRRRIAVPFGALWRRVLERAEARRLGRRWRRWLSWLWMVVIAACVLAALGEGPLGLRALTERRQPPPIHTVIVVDCSASMATVDGDRGEGVLDRSRLDEAKRRIGALLDDALPQERFLLIAAASAPRTQGPWTSDRVALDGMVAELAAVDADFDRRRALRAAGDALRDRGEARVVVVSDGGPAAIDGVGAGADVDADVAVEAVVVGPGRALPEAERRGRGVVPIAVDNVAVEHVGVRERAGDPGRGVVQVSVRNDRGEPSRVRVLLASRGAGQAPVDFASPDAVIAERVIDVPARAHASAQFTDVSLAGGRFAVRVQPAVDAAWRDRAAWDDWGFAVAAHRRRLGVLLVSPGNLFLRAALLANERVDVRQIAPDAYRPEAFARAARLQHGVDVVVLDQVAKAAPEGTPTLRFDLKAHDAAAPGAALARPADALRVVADRHPVTRGLSMHDSHIDGLRVLLAGAGATVLIAEADGSAAADARDDGVRRVDFGIDLLETDLGGRFFLPLLLSNAVDWLAGEEEPVVSALELGRPWAIGMPVVASDWRWQEPGRPEVAARTSDDALLAVSERQGIHVWRSDTGFELARPTVLPPGERPDRVVLRDASWRPRSADAHRSAPSAPLPAWATLLAAAAAMLTLEWWLYQRRRTV